MRDVCFSDVRDVHEHKKGTKSILEKKRGLVGQGKGTWGGGYCRIDKEKRDKFSRYKKKKSQNGFQTSSVLDWETCADATRRKGGGRRKV